MAREVVIDRRYRGPPASANGGYTCGIVAGEFAAPGAEVNLRRPPPLDRPLRLESGVESTRLLDGDAVVAEGRPLYDLELELPRPPPLHVAEDADARYPYYDDHAFPGCFVCGPERKAGDGLRIYPGPVAGGLLACVWTPETHLADEAGAVRNEIVWAALDCPSGNAAHHFSPDERWMVLARLRGMLLAAIEPGRPHIVAGWATGADGRKHGSGTAIFDAAGTALAFAQALWIELREDGR